MGDDPGAIGFERRDPGDESDVATNPGMGGEMGRKQRGEPVLGGKRKMSCCNGDGDDDDGLYCDGEL